MLTIAHMSPCERVTRVISHASHLHTLITAERSYQRSEACDRVIFPRGRSHNHTLAMGPLEVAPRCGRHGPRARTPQPKKRIYP